MNITIDDTSPQIKYNGAWIDWRPAREDPDTGSYFRGTFHSAHEEGSYVSFTFNGSSAWLYGSFWLNHGAYSASIDGGEEQTFQGYTSTRRFNQVLFSTGELKYGPHEVRLFNRPSRTTTFEQNKAKLNGDDRLWIDLDYVMVQVPVPEDKEITTRVIDDTDASITYSPEWQLRPGSENGYYNVSAHVTNTAGADLTFEFRGISIQLFGVIGPDIGNYSVSIDGRDNAEPLNGTWYERRTKSPLFSTSGLEDRDHRIYIRNLGPNVEKSTFEFDYAVVNTTSAHSSIANTTAPDGAVDDPSNVSTLPPPTSAPTSTGGSSGTDAGTGMEGGGSSMGAIVGGAVGGIAALALLGLLLYCLRKKRKERMGGGGTSSGGSDYFDKSNPNTPRSGGRFDMGIALPLSPRSNSNSKSKSGFSTGSDAVHIYPLPYQGGHASRGIPSAQVYPYSPDFAASPGRYGRTTDGAASTMFNRAALGTSVDKLASENDSDPQKMRQRGFEPPSEISSTTWAGSPGPESGQSELLPSGMQLLYHPHHPHHQNDPIRANGDSTGLAYLPLSASPHHSPFTPLHLSPMLHSAGGAGQGQSGYISLGTPVSPLHHVRDRGAGSGNDRGYTVYPLAGTAEHLAHAHAYPPIERDRDTEYRRYRPREAEDELSPQDSCSNVGGPTHGHVPGDPHAPTQTMYETGLGRPSSPDAHRHEHGHGHGHETGCHAPPGYVESVSSGGGSGGAAGSAAVRAAAATARKT